MGESIGTFCWERVKENLECLWSQGFSYGVKKPYYLDNVKRILEGSFFKKGKSAGKKKI